MRRLGGADRRVRARGGRPAPPPRPTRRRVTWRSRARLRARAHHDPAGTTVTWRNGDALEPHGDVRGRRVRLGLPRAGRQLLVHVRQAGPLRLRVPHPQVHEGHASTSSRSSSRDRSTRSSSGRQVVVAGLAPAGTASVTLSRARRRRASPNRQGAARRQLHGAVPRDGAGHLPRLGRSAPRARWSGSGSSRASASPTPRRPSTSRPFRRGVGARVALQAYDRDHFTWRTVAHARLDRRSQARLAIPRRTTAPDPRSSFAARQAGPTPPHR